MSAARRPMACMLLLAMAAPSLTFAAHSLGRTVLAPSLPAARCGARCAVEQPSPEPSQPKQGSQARFLTDAAARIACSSAASAGTWALTAKCGVSSVASSSLLGLAAGALLPMPLATAAFCGTFAGMSSQAVLPNAPAAAALGAAAAALLAALDATGTRLLKGYGGRLGAVAALAVVASMAGTPALVSAGLLFDPSFSAAAAAPRPLLGTVSATIAGSAAMRLWARRLALLLLVGGTSSPLLSTGSKRAAAARRLSNPVASASITGLLASAVFGPSHAALAASAFAGAFVAMSAPEKLMSNRALLSAAAFAGGAQVKLGKIPTPNRSRSSPTLQGQRRMCPFLASRAWL